MSQKLPIYPLLSQIRIALESSGKAIISAPPGSGKTTIVPLELLHEPWLLGRRIILLQPRRLAARSCAVRMASLLGEPVGQTVGYRVRLDRMVSSQTRIEVVTEGILTRRIQQDPELADIGLIVFDEFHERSLHADLALALSLDVCADLRTDLRLLVMSATLDTDALSKALGGAKILHSDGRCHAVERRYLSRDPGTSIHQAAALCVTKALQTQQGDILVFLPGAREIRNTERLLAGRLDLNNEVLCVLHGSIGRVDQDRAMRPDPEGKRRIILATSIAETSLTIEGVSTVVDCGWSRKARFDQNSGLTRLETVRVSLASANQRSGRAGRLGPGVCYRLWSKETQLALRDTDPPEVLESDLSSLVLELAQWGVMAPEDLIWLDPPAPAAVERARQLLRDLHALDPSGRITMDGRRMLKMALHPRLARMLLKAQEMGCEGLGADLAALISERDIVKRSLAQSVTTDIAWRLELLDVWRRQGSDAVEEMGGESSACKRVARLSKRLTSERNGRSMHLKNPVHPGVLLAMAFPDRIAGRRANEWTGYQLVSGRGVRLPDGDALSGSDYLVAVDLDLGRREGKVFKAIQIDVQQLRITLQGEIEFTCGVKWDIDSRSVIAREEERMGALLLSTRCFPNPDPEAVQRAMLEGVQSLGLDVLPWSRSAREWQKRVLSLRSWQPDAGWPDVSRSGLIRDLEAWLLPWLIGITRVQHLRRLDLGKILESQLNWSQQQLLVRLAPTHIRVPSGSLKKLDYSPGTTPVLRVQLQEMFGMKETPRVCDGLVPVTLHLLSPAQRPVQVTQDLDGFWSRTYLDVRKELKGRYPKHYWPDDPEMAVATSRVKKARRRLAKE